MKHQRWQKLVLLNNVALGLCKLDYQHKIYLANEFEILTPEFIEFAEDELEIKIWDHMHKTGRFDELICAVSHYSKYSQGK